MGGRTIVSVKGGHVALLLNERMNMAHCTSHPTRNLNGLIACRREGDTIIVESSGIRIATLPTAQMKGPRRSADKRLSKLFGDIEAAESQAKSMASRGVRKGLSYQALYRSGKASMLRSKGWPEGAVLFAERALASAVMLEGSRAGRARS